MYNFARDLISRTFVTRKVLRISSRNLCPSSTTITIYHTPTKKTPKKPANLSNWHHGVHQIANLAVLVIFV